MDIYIERLALHCGQDVYIDMTVTEAISFQLSVVT